MNIEINFLQLLGGVILGTGTIVFSLWKIFDNMKKDVNSKFEKISDDKHKQDIDILIKNKEISNEYEKKLNEIHNEFKHEIAEIWTDVECNKDNVIAINGKIDNIGDKYVSIIKETTEIKEQLRDLYNKFNDLTNKIIELLNNK
jgi:chromosome segregation ATPase